MTPRAGTVSKMKLSPKQRNILNELSFGSMAWPDLARATGTTLELMDRICDRFLAERIEGRPIRFQITARGRCALEAK